MVIHVIMYNHIKTYMVIYYIVKLQETQELNEVNR